MLALLLAWLLILVLAASTGWWLLGIFDARRAVARVGDRALLAAWLGLSASSVLFAILSLIGPLTPARGLALVVLLLTALWSRDGVRQESRALYAALRANPGLSGISGLAALAVAAHATQRVSNYDPGLYHYQHIRWLSEVGVVPGLALIHGRFGFSGSWFALPAVFNHSLLEARVATIAGGLTQLLALWQWLLCARRCLGPSPRAVDGFGLAGFGLMLLYVLDKGWFNVSSPDAPVFVLSLLCASLMLQTTRGTSALPVLIAICAVGCKLSAAPLLIVCAWHAGWRHALRTAAFGLPIAGMLIAESLLTTGCLAYPLAQSCLGVDWGVGTAAAAREAAEILQWARWSGLPPPSTGTGGWFPSWLSAHDVEIGLFVVAALLLAWRWTRLRTVAGAGGVATLALVNIALGMWLAPDARFWGGNLFALLGLAALTLWPARADGLRGLLPSVAVRPWLMYAACGTFVLLALAALARKPLAVLWRPPALESPAATLLTNAAGVAYWLPANGNQCWAAPLPCAPARLPDTVRYRSIQDGIKSGFERAR